MDANSIDENMTVPHPSQHPTTTTTSTTTAAAANPRSQIYSTRAELQNHPEHQIHSQPNIYRIHNIQQQQQQQQQHQQQPHQQQQQAAYQLDYGHHQTQQPQFYVQAPNSNERPQDELMEQLMLLVHDTHQTDDLVKRNRDAYQMFVIQLQNRTKLLHNLSYHESLAQPDFTAIEKAKRDIATFEAVLRQKANELNSIRMRLLQAHCDIFNRLSNLQNKVLCEHLPQWHRSQQYSNNGFPSESVSLNQIQSWVEKLVDVTWRIKNQIKGLQLTLADKPNVPFDMEQLEQFIVCVNKSLEDLVLNTFVVEKQPPQVMKTNTRFTSTVRFLSGPKLNVQITNPTVKAIILSESNARAIIQKHKEMIDASWAYIDCQQNPDSQQPRPMQTQQQQQATSVISPPLGQTQIHGQQQQLAGYNSPSQAAMMTGIQPKQVVATTPHISAQQHAQLFQQPAQFSQQQQPQQHLSQYPQQQQQLSASHTRDSLAYQQVQNKILNLNEFDPSGEILNNSNILEYQDATGQLLCHFRNMQLKKIKRTEKKGTESVMDEKFVLLFHTELRIPDANFCLTHSSSAKSNSCIERGDLYFQLMAFSLPVVVIVHGNQEPHAWATVTWHNAFATPDELLYQVPDRVHWRDLGNVLSEKFRSCAGKGLSGHNLEYLASKVYRGRLDNDDILVSWNQFAKEQLADRQFTFWEWFHSILKLTKEHLRDLWTANRIYGFVGKKGCMDLLLGSSCHEPAPVGTFLLRYSETELGGITIAWVSTSSKMNKTDLSVQVSQRLSPTISSSNVLMHLQPFTSKDLNTRSLADRIRDLKDLVSLFPDIPKDEAFKAYYTPLNETSLLSNGYVMPMLIQTLATNYPKDSAGGGGCGGGGGAASNSMDCTTTPSPPNSFSQSSPDGIYQDNALLSNMDSNYQSSYDHVAGEFGTTLQ